LIPLGEEAGNKIAHAVHQPKVGFVGLQLDAPGAMGLIDLLRTNIQAVDVPWLRESCSPTYLPVKVKQTAVKVGQKKEKVKYFEAKNAQI